MPGPSKRLVKEGFFLFKKTATEGLCWVRGCKNKACDDRAICKMHQMRRWRTLHKPTADYCELRVRAKKRGISFTITPDYWRGVIDAYCFYESDEPLTIDRVNPTSGYEPGNIRVISKSENSKKSCRERFLPEHVQHMIERKRNKIREELGDYLSMTDDAEGNPF